MGSFTARELSSYSLCDFFIFCELTRHNNPPHKESAFTNQHANYKMHIKCMYWRAYNNTQRYLAVS